jgi:hypothetical protein
MTDFEMLCILLAYESRRLSFYERQLLKKFYDGLRGLGTEIDDQEIQSYLSEKQIAFIRRCGKKRHLKKEIRLDSKR